MKKLLIFSFIFVLVFASCSKSQKIVVQTPTSNVTTPTANQEEVQETLSLKIAHNQTSLDNPYVYGANAFKEKLEQISGGNILVEVFNGTMDQDEGVLLEKLNSGEASIVVVTPSWIKLPEIDIFSLEYLFDNFAHWKSCLDGSFGMELSDIVKTKTNNQYQILGYWSAGVRNYYGKKPIAKPQDLEGMTIRISSSPVQQEFWKACGAIPKSVSWGELYDALNNDEVDSAENDYTNLSLKEHHKAKNGKYICETEHDFTTRFMLINGEFFDSLSYAQQGQIIEAAQYATEIERQRTFEQLSSSKEKTVEEGAIITENENIDIKAFKEIAIPIQDEYAKTNSMERFLDLVRNQK